MTTRITEAQTNTMSRMATPAMTMEPRRRRLEGAGEVASTRQGRALSQWPGGRVVCAVAERSPPGNRPRAMATDRCTGYLRTMRRKPAQMSDRGPLSTEPDQQSVEQSVGRSVERSLDYVFRRPPPRARRGRSLTLCRWCRRCRSVRPPAPASTSVIAFGRRLAMRQHRPSAQRRREGPLVVGLRGSRSASLEPADRLPPWT